MPLLCLRAKNKPITHGLLAICLSLLTIHYSLFTASFARAAADTSLSLVPSSGSYLVDSVFEVTVLLDTHGQQINTVELNMSFPPEILQIIKPVGGVSFIQSWFSPPAFSNKDGTLRLVGGIAPGGINTSEGLVTTMAFRAVAPGEATLSIHKTSRVLAHDGQGTDVLGSRGSASFHIRVRPPEGPEVSSATHPDPNRWYQNNAPIFTWPRVEGGEGYGYLLNQNAQEIPPAQVNSTDLVRAFTGVPDGIHYFHLRFLRDDAWSGATHFPMRIDTVPPLAFTPRVEYAPQLGTPPLVFFETKDAHAGVDHYAIKVIRTDEVTGSEEDITPFFVETESPYKVPVEFPGKYTVVVRSYDRAGNTQDATVSLVTPTVALLSDQGIKFQNYFIPFKFVYAFFGFLLIALFLWGIYLLRNIRAMRVRMKHDISSLSEGLQKEYMRFGEHLTHELGRGQAPQQVTSVQLQTPVGTPKPEPDLLDAPPPPPQA